ncbi:hypothetical protein C3L33_03934, partial [Rhododendron williamsianum]
KIHRFDTTAAPPADGWRAILSMLTPRESPETVVIDGKLYVFGGSDPCVTFAEMFDPCLISSTSVPLPDLPPPLCWPANRWLHQGCVARWSRLMTTTSASYGRSRWVTTELFCLTCVTAATVTLCL